MPLFFYFYLYFYKLRKILHGGATIAEITINNLTFAYDGSYDNIFENVSFKINTDWKLGFTGRNGRGKTTFLNILLGNLEYSGHISSPVDFSYFPFVVSNPELTTQECVDAIYDGYEEWELYVELSQLEVDEGVLTRPFKTLSFGEQTKVLLATLFLRHNNFLLIDEPTNHLDIHAREIVAEYLNSKKGFILVSHDRNVLDTCVDHVLSINKTNIEIQKGTFSQWWHNKQMQDNYEIEQNEKLRKDVKRLTAAARRAAQWSNTAEGRKIGFRPDRTEKSLDRRAYEGEKSRKMMKTAKVIEDRRNKAAEDKSKLLKNIETTDSLKLNPLNYHSNNLLTLSNIAISYDDNIVCQNVNLAVSRGDRIAVTGKNGCGKSSLLKLILGEVMPYSGEYYKGSSLVISYISQDTPVAGNLRDYAASNGLDESLFKAILRKLDFARVQFEKDMSDFSAGQKKKVLIAKSLCEKAHLFIWDEPLNYVDVISRMQIEELILDYTPTLIFVEHDAAFCEKIATKNLAL